MPKLTQPSAFKNHPQRFPQTQKAAGQLAQALQQLAQKASPIVIGTIADVSFHATRGYVTCSTEAGVISVYSVPIGSAVAQMRIMCQPVRGTATHRGYVFAGFAPTKAGLGDSGSLVISYATTTSAIATTTSTGMPSLSGLSTSAGYYWHCFFFLPALPASTVTLFSMVSGSNVLTLDYLPMGYVRFHDQNTDGYQSVLQIVPHTVHWLQIQPGLPGLELLIDGVANYSVLTSIPAFTGGGAAYQGSYLSNLYGASACPPGSWVAKMGYGTSYSGGVLALPNVIPTSDADIPLFSGVGGQNTTNLYLGTAPPDVPGSATMLNSGTGGSNLTLIAPGQLVVPGPY